MGEHCSGIDFAEQQGGLTSQGLPEVAARAAGRHEEMKRTLPLTLPVEGSIYPFKIDGCCELHAVDRIDLGQGLMYLRALSAPHKERPTFINDVVRMMRPNDAAAWLPTMRKHYTMDDEGRAALIAEAKSRSVGDDLAWVDSLECGPYTPMVVCHNGEDLARAFPRVPNDDLSRDRYATIGDPVPPLVWPRQESEQSPTRSETALDEPPVKVLESTVFSEPGMPHVMRVEDFTIGDRVMVVKKVEVLSNGASTYWQEEMDATIGLTGKVLRTAGGDGRVSVDIESTSDLWWYAPEALALENACSEVTTAPVAIAVEEAPAKPHVFKTGERVIVARKVERDSTGHWCFWPQYDEVVLGLSGTIEGDVRDKCGAYLYVNVTGLGGRYFSPEALDLVTAAE